VRPASGPPPRPAQPPSAMAAAPSSGSFEKAVCGSCTIFLCYLLPAPPCCWLETTNAVPILFFCNRQPLNNYCRISRVQIRFIPSPPARHDLVAAGPHFREVCSFGANFMCEMKGSLSCGASTNHLAVSPDTNPFGCRPASQPRRPYRQTPWCTTRSLCR
jgi:hypothetical protein